MSLPARQTLPFAASDTTDSIDHLLVQLAQTGDETTLAYLFERYNARIHLYLARMVGDDEVGRELAQETFLKAWESLSRLRDPSRFSSWLYRIATNIAYDYLQKPHLLWIFPGAIHRERVKAKELADVTQLEQRVEEHELLILALQKVPLTYRACVVLQIVEEFPQRQIATLARCSNWCITLAILTSTTNNNRSVSTGNGRADASNRSNAQIVSE